MHCTNIVAVRHYFAIVNKVLLSEYIIYTLYSQYYIFGIIPTFLFHLFWILFFSVFRFCLFVCLSFSLILGLTIRNAPGCSTIQPLCLGGFVAYFAQSEKDNAISRSDAYWYASGIVLSMAAMICGFHPTILYIFKTSCKLRVASAGLMYRKAMRMSKSSVEDGLNGKIINLLSNDLYKSDLGFSFLHDIWKGPMEAVIFFIVMYYEIGISAVIGMAFLLSFIPLQGIVQCRSFYCSRTIVYSSAKFLQFTIELFSIFVDTFQRGLVNDPPSYVYRRQNEPISVSKSWTKF